MKQTNYQPDCMASSAMFGAVIAAAVLTLAAPNSVRAQQETAPATQLKLPAEQVEKLEQNEAIRKEKDDRAGAITPSDQKANQEEPPDNIRDSQKSPAKQEDELPAVQQDQLPAMHKDRLPAVQREKLPGTASPTPDKRQTLDGDMPAGGGFVDQDTVDGLKSDTQPDIQPHHTPGTGFVPLPDDAGAGPSACDPSERGPGWAQECLRERTPDIRITGMGNYDESRGCVADWDTIELEGHGFGHEQGTRQALLTRTASDRRGPDTVAELEAIEWRDNRVHLDVPEYRLRRGVNYYVGIWSAGGEALAAPESLQFCNASCNW
ncbi:MAG: hypothetical protein U5P41_08235 [Gammaproteobacteria bacterium]|nr:hypothetical protein [Gammaproteobacteria bacterium]